MKKGTNYYLENSADFGWGEGSASLDKERAELLKKFVSGQRVLDVGCGMGVYTEYLNELGFDSYGVDFVKEFIEEGNKRRAGKYILGKAEKLPFKTKEFDTVIMFDILEHGDDKKILNEAKRVAKERVIIIVPTHVDKKLIDTGVIYKHYIDKSHLREYSLGEIKKLASSLGFKVLDLRFLHPLYVETIFMALFDGPVLLKKVIRKIILGLFRKVYYPTEVFAVLEVNK